MSESLDLAYRSIDAANSGEGAATRRQLVAGAAATLGGLGLLGLAEKADAQGTGIPNGGNDPQTILNVAATAEVLATIVNTVGFERVNLRDAPTRRNIRAAAREELIHFDQLVGLGAKPVTRRIWVPDRVFAGRTQFLKTVEVGDQIFINAYLIATHIFGRRGSGRLAQIAAETMGVEAVHRALARQSLGELGNDRVFIKFDNVENARGAANRGQPGFKRVEGAVTQLQAAGFGFGVEGAKPGRFYDFDEVRRRTPNDPDLNSFVYDTD